MSIARDPFENFVILLNFCILSDPPNVILIKIHICYLMIE